MTRLVLFGGTTEQHALIDALAPLPLAVTLSVVSDYGRALLPPDRPGLTVRVGRLDEDAMTALLDGALCAVDATHPYAVEASRNIRAAAKRAGIPYLHLLRPQSELDGCVCVPDIESAVDALNARTGAVLVTTGSKELAAFSGVSDYRNRLYARVLPTVEAITQCQEMGLAPSHIIAMQGPFSRALNVALLREYSIQTLATKDGGAPGGFAEKRDAAVECGVELLVVRRPVEDGDPLDRILTQIKRLLEERL